LCDVKEFETNLRKERQMEGIAKAKAAGVRVPTKPAMHSNLKPAGYSDRKPATLGVNRMGRFDDVVEG